MRAREKSIKQAKLTPYFLLLTSYFLLFTLYSILQQYFRFLPQAFLLRVIHQVQLNVDIFASIFGFMISSNDFRTGVTVELDGSVWRVVEFLHVKPGKGSAFVRTKLKNVQTGNTVDRTFRAGETVPQANIEKRSMQHTYKDGDEYVFMDMETYEETRMNGESLGDRTSFLKEEMEVNVLFWDEQVLEIELPTSVVLEITDTDPGVKGDTATGGTKPATVETGAQVMVPLFISIGEEIKVDTRDGSYLGREN